MVYCMPTQGHTKALFPAVVCVLEPYHSQPLLHVGSYYIVCLFITQTSAQTLSHLLKSTKITVTRIGDNPAGDAGDVSPPIFWLVGTSMGMSPPIFGVTM